MKKLLMLSALVFAFCLLGASAQAQNQCSCWQCGQYAICKPGNSTGGCGCIQTYVHGIRYCATCGFCIAGVCTYGCPPAATAPTEAALRLWLPIASLRDRIAPFSIAMSGLIAAQQDALNRKFKADDKVSGDLNPDHHHPNDPPPVKTTNTWQGKAYNEATKEEYDWTFIADDTGSHSTYILFNKGADESKPVIKEILTLREKSWSLTRDGADVVVNQPYDLPKTL